MSLSGQKRSRILITCPKGIPPLLKDELRALGYPALAEHLAGVETEGTFDDMIALNFAVRTGHRVLALLAEWEATTADDLYQAVAALPWEDYLEEEGYVSVTSSVDTPSIRDSRYASLRCKDAIVDRMRDARGTRPDAGPERDKAVVHLYWKDGHAALYLDTSGVPLSRRGYRMIPLAAPMQETLAAAVVLASRWTGAGNFINPMCGSGTLAIEAALVALHRAPGLLRRNFGFMHLKVFSEARWAALRQAAQARSRDSFPGRIIATDRDPAAVDAAQKNAAAAGVGHLIEFSCCDYADTPLPEGGGVILLNPEYGERMGEVAQLAGVYRDIGDFFKQKCRGYRAYVFTGNPGLGKKVSLKPGRSLALFNSGIECRLLEYELYEGTRKVKKQKRASPGS